MLANRFPHILWWSPQFVQFYNDPYVPIPGKKHPDIAFGRPGHECWSEIWHIIGPLIERTFSGGPAAWDEDIFLEIDRHGFREESHFTFAYSPVPDDAAPNGIGGVLGTVHEITEKVVSERRLTALRDLGTRPADAKTAEEACSIICKTLEAHTRDIPFALLYLTEPGGKRARLAGTTGISAFSEGFSPQSIDLGSAAGSPWPLARAMQTSEAQIVEGLVGRLGSSPHEIPPGPWSDPPNTAVVLPIRSSSAHEIAGFLVAGVSSRLRLDDAYLGFLELVTAQVATAISTARAFEEEKRRAEALAELDRAKTAFFSNVSHEFRTPLTLMLGPVEDLLANSRNDLSPATAAQLEVVSRNGTRLLRLVNTLLDFSRIEAGRVRANYQPTNLAGFTTDLASVFRSACERAGIDLVVMCTPLSEPVFVDRDMWEKVVLNLLSNAFKFTFEGAIKVTLRRARAGDSSGEPKGAQDHVEAQRGTPDCEPRPDAKAPAGAGSAESTAYLAKVTAAEVAELIVEDTGTGIAPEEIPRLFERFHRVQNARGRTHEGSGIGLALVQELVKLHGGSVSATSVLGRGTTLTVKIPLGFAHLPPGQIGENTAPLPDVTGASPFIEEALRWFPDRSELDRSELPAHLESVPTPGQTGKPAPPGRTGPTGHPGPPGRTGGDASPFVLVADDNADMRRYIVHLLGEQYRVEAVPDGEAALEAARARRPDLVLSDVMMPRLDGVGLLKELRADPRTRDVPVIMLSARAGEESRVEGLEAGADDYLIKPFGARELLARVSAHVQMARLRRESDRRKDEFLATLAHELRNPLAPLLNGLSMMRLTKNDPAVVEQVRTMMERQLGQMIRLIDDLLDLNRISRGTIELRKEHVDVATVLTQAVETSRPAIEQAGHELIMSLPSEGTYVDADITRLSQAFANLLNNAAKFTPKGGTILLTAHSAVEGPDRQLVVSIKDTGVGIPADKLGRIFDMFSQVDQSLEKSHGGLGIGLTIVKRLIEMHGGTVEAHSEGVGKGSELIVRLPVVMRESLRLPVDRPGEDASMGAERRILVVDDNRDSAESLATLLRLTGHEAYMAYDGEQAVGAALEHRPDVILLDIGLPGLNGYEVCRTIRSQPWSKAAIIIALTGWGQEEDRRKSTEVGFNGHLVKPVDHRALMKLLASVT